MFIIINKTLIMNSLDLKLKRKKLGMTQLDLAKRLGVDRMTIINYENGRVIPESKVKLLNIILNNESKNEIKAKSEALEIEVNEPYIIDVHENKNANKFIKLPNGQYLMTLPLAEYNIQAGFLDHFQDLDYLADMAQHSIIVDKPVQGRYVAFRVKGNSMEDGSDESIKESSIVSCRELQRHHWTSKLRINDFPYWVIYTSESQYPLLKQIINHDIDNRKILCHSLNMAPEYSDFELNLNDVQALFYIVDVSKSISKKLYY